MKTQVLKIVICLSLVLLPVSAISAQSELTSSNYKIIDPQVDSGGGSSESTNYGLLQSLGNPTADSRLTSTSYKIGSGFPNGIQANVPLIICAETDTTSGTTDCNDFPNANGAQGECGSPGCYDRFKLEIDPQNNPIDALYLVSITDQSSSIEYFLQSNHTISTTYDIADYMTLCALQGKDVRTGSGCETNSDPEWDEDLQRLNVFSISPGKTYQVKARALNGDYTEGGYSPVATVTTEVPILAFDIDIANSGGFAANNTGLYNINLGFLTPGIVKTATDRIWMDMNTNIIPGFDVKVTSLNNGLAGASATVPSQAENLDTDGGDGGYGLKVETITQTSLGVITAHANYNTAGVNQVGSVTGTAKNVFSTDPTGGNVGQVVGGRGSLSVKALASTGSIAESISDVLTFTMVPKL